jgi:hypothetical protein
MRKLLILLGALGLFAGPAVAQDLMIDPAIIDFVTIDANANGSVSYDELVVFIPELTGEQFAEADVDVNGELSEDELAAFVELHASTGDAM